MAPSTTQTMLEDPLAFFSRAAAQSNSNNYSSASTRTKEAPSASARFSAQPFSSFASQSASAANSANLPSAAHLSEELPSSYPPPTASYSYVPASSVSSDRTSPSSLYGHPPVQRVSLLDSPLLLVASQPSAVRQYSQPQTQVQAPLEQPRNSSPDYSSYGSAPVSAPRHRANAPAAPAPEPVSPPPPPAPPALALVDPLTRMSSLSRGSYGSFSAPDCPHIVTRLMIPIYLFLALFVVIVYSLENNRCGNYAARVEHGWCCMETSFSRYLSIGTFVIHAVMLTWLLQLYHTPYWTFFPLHNRSLIMASFFLRAAFLIGVWMLYFLILSLNLISTLPEQVKCSTTVYDRYLFYPAAVLNIACCMFVKVMLGLMGKSIWKYWELRHLTPEELLAYEEQQEENKHYGLTREQVDVLTNVILTCHDTVSDGSTCGVCGHSAEYQPPSLAHVLGEKIAPRISAVNSFLHRRRQHSGENGGAADELFAGVQIHSDDQQNDANAYLPPSPSPPSPPPASPLQPVPYPGALERQSSSGSVDSGQPKSKASLVAKGGLPTMTCGICLEDYRNHDRVLILPCRHHGHIDCLMGWLNGHRSCPTCRSSVVKVQNSRRRGQADWERERERERAERVLY